MSDGNKNTRDKPFWRAQLGRLGKTAILPASIIILAVLVYLFEHMMFPVFEHSTKAVFVSVFCVLAIVTLSALISASYFRANATDKTAEDLAVTIGECKNAQESWKARRDEHLHSYNAAKSNVQKQIKRLEEEKLAFEAECEQTRRSLENQEHEFYRMVESQHGWLYNHEQILQLEADTDSEILVMAPDFFYEQQPQYENVIIQNLLKPAAPVYEYFVPVSEQNRGALKDLRQRLERGLAQRACATAQATVESRFKVHPVPDEDFPHCVAYGLAIYRFKDQDKNRCLTYWPKEIGSWNLDILAAGKQGDGKKIVDAITSYLRGLAEKYPAC